MYVNFYNSGSNNIFQDSSQRSRVYILFQTYSVLARLWINIFRCPHKIESHVSNLIPAGPYRLFHLVIFTALVI